MPRRPPGDASRRRADEPLRRDEVAGPIPDAAALSQSDALAGARRQYRISAAQVGPGVALALHRVTPFARVVPVLRDHADELHRGRRLLLQGAASRSRTVRSSRRPS
jgi:hypothetical protein